jgi:hypothetical protein
MLLRFTKHDAKAPTLTCIRDDGTTTWFRSETNGEYFVFHDLTHYCIETVLGYVQAFWGIVAAGRDLNDFGSTDGTPDQREYAPEASYAEVLAGFLTARSNMSDEEQVAHLSYDAAMTHMCDICAEYGLVAPQITEEQYTEILEQRADLWERWLALEPGSSLELTFPKV